MNFWKTFHLVHHGTDRWQIEDLIFQLAILMSKKTSLKSQESCSQYINNNINKKTETINRLRAFIHSFFLNKLSMLFFIASMSFQWYCRNVVLEKAPSTSKKNYWEKVISFIYLTGYIWILLFFKKNFTWHHAQCLFG
jgi:uncharacterized protein YqhQ